MGRTIGAVIAGTVLWGIVWNAGNAALGAALPDLYVVGEPLTNVGVLVGLIVFSAIVSVGAGWVAAAIKGEPDAMVAVKALAALNLVIGIAVEISYWAMMPAWFHIIFLALVVPATIVGGRMKAGGGAT